MAESYAEVAKHNPCAGAIPRDILHMSNPRLKTGALQVSPCLWGYANTTWETVCTTPIPNQISGASWRGEQVPGNSFPAAIPVLANRSRNPLETPLSATI